MIWSVEFVTGFFLNFSSCASSIIFKSEIKPAIATSAALAAPSVIFTAKADFSSGISAKKTPSAPFLKNIFPFEILVKLQLTLFVPPVSSGNFVQDLNILRAIAEWSLSFL